MGGSRAAGPSGRRQLLWDHRTLTRLSRDRYRLDIPISGPPAPPTPTSDRTLSRFLHRAWIVHPTPATPQAQSVMAGIHPATGEHEQQLIVVIDATPGQRFHEQACAADLRAALALLASS